MGLKRDHFLSKKRNGPFLGVLISACGFSFNAFALPHSSDDLFDLTLNELLEIRVGITSNRPSATRDHPGVVSLINSDQIRVSGARDLKDILKLVPGFWIQGDANAIQTLSFRGIYGYDGKILVLLDDIELNDLQFGGVILNNHFPADMIHSVEVVRGPGSVVYGGTAELAVIKINTKKSVEDNGVHVNVSSSEKLSTQLLANLAHESTNLSASLNVYQGRAQISEEPYTSLAGDTFDMNGNSQVDSTLISFAMDYGKFSYQMVYDEYRFEDRTSIGGIGTLLPPNFSLLDDNLKMSFKSLFAQVGYEWQSLNKWDMSAQLTSHQDEPWRSAYPDGRLVEFQGSRLRGELKGVKDLNADNILMLGAGAYEDFSEIASADQIFVQDTATHYSGKGSVDYQDYYAYGQLESKTSAGTLVTALRYDNHSYAGDRLVPRLSLNNGWDNSHLKLIYSQAFRIPQVETIQSSLNKLNQDLKTETAEVYEVEWGYQLSPDWFVQSNLYSMEVNNYIVFDAMELAVKNQGEVSTTGVEFMLKTLGDWGRFDAVYSYYQAYDTSVSAIKVDQDGKSLLGTPNHKLNLMFTSSLTAQSWVTVNGTYIGERYACVEDINFVCGTPIELNPEFDLSVMYEYDFDPMEVAIGVKNALDSNMRLVQANNGGYAPVQDLGRQYLLSLTYQM